MSNEVITRVTQLINAFDARVQAAPADSWSNGAPCDGWTARDVVVHVGNNLLRMGAGLSGGEGREISADEDIAAAWEEAKGSFFGALPTADLSTSMPMGPMGPMPAEQIIGRFMSNDVLVHTWDLARATGGDESLDATSVEAAYSGLKPMDAMLRMPGMFGAKVESAPDADLQTQFLNFLGRTV